MKHFLTFFVFVLCTSLYSQIKGLDPLIKEKSTANKTYAVVVGISDYQDEGIPDLRFADQDAKAFASFLQSPSGGSLDQDHLKVLINEKATAAQFAIALDWLWEVTKENDRVIIYFSGHGDVERKSITQPGYLLCWDAPARVYMAGGAFNVRDLNDVVSTLSVQNKAKVILVTDACRAGKLSGSSIGGAQATAANLSKQFNNEIKILSCQPDEFSIEGEQWGGGRGAFSYHLLDGLTGMADGNADYAINLKEIGRYLEDNVTEEVAPQSQNPMIIGSKTELLTEVFPEILEQLKEGKKGQLELFTTTDVRGIEDQVLAKADTNIVEMYYSFKKSIANKNFLCDSTKNCADSYYEKLSREPQLKKLHSSMRRNYAAALQDDAQQLMNTMLKSGLTEIILKQAKFSDIYYNYPAYLEKAAELLGNDHYMYSTLMARKYFFEGRLKRKRKKRRSFYHKALKLQPNMPHALVELIRSSDADQLDSVNYYFERVNKLIPSWVEPYNALSHYYFWRLKDAKKAEEMLDLAEQLDSSSILISYEKGRLFKRTGRTDLAIQYLRKTVKGTSNDICFPCAYSVLANVHLTIGEAEEAISNYQKVIELAPNEKPTLVESYTNIGLAYRFLANYDEAEKMIFSAIQVDSTYGPAWVNLGQLYERMNKGKELKEAYNKALLCEMKYAHQFAHLGLAKFYQKNEQFIEAEKHFLKAIKLNPKYVDAFRDFGVFCLYNHRYTEAEEYLQKALELNPESWQINMTLSVLHQRLFRWSSSKEMIEKAIELNPEYGLLYGILGNALSHLPDQMEEAKYNLDKGLSMSSDSPVMHFYITSWHFMNNQLDKAWFHFEKGLNNLEEPRELRYVNIQDNPDFKEMRKDQKWNKLILKKFPDQTKTINK